MPSSTPTKFYKPHVRLEKDLREDPPALKCCITVWVEGGKKLVDVSPTDLSNPPIIIRYTVATGTNQNDHWEHFEQEWDWDDYPKEKIFENVVVPDGTSHTSSSDRAEPCRD